MNRRAFVISFATSVSWIIPVAWKVATSPTARHFLFSSQPRLRT